MSFERYQQFYKGIKVEGGYYSFRFRNGEMIAAKGNYIKIKEINPIPTISENDAIRQFLSFLDIGAYSGKELSISLVIKELTVKEGMQAFLVYKLEMQNPKTRKFETGYIDAHSGRILFHEQKTYCSSAIGTFQTLYNNTVSGETDNYQGTYRLYDSTRGNGIHTYSSPSENNLYEITDNDNNWTVNELGSNRMGLDIQWTLEKIYDVLKNSYNHNSYDGQNGTINAHITPWDNTKFLPNPTSLHFNTGNWYTNPMASIDVIAHEFGHAILYYTCDWTSAGALHEGFADIWGILFEHRINPNKDIWKTGEDIMIGYSCMRNFANPSDPFAYNQIATTYGVNLGYSSDPHIAGGIIPYWFYLLVHGGDALNEAGNHYLVFPMGYDIVEQLIIYTALNPSYLEGCTTYTSVRNAFIEAAEDLGDSFLANQIANAWYAVGIGSSGNTVSISGPSDIYNTSVYGVQNLPSIYTVLWSLTGDNASNFTVQNNTPSANQCTITRKSDVEFSGSSALTLSAQISYNAMPVTTITKTICAPYISGSSSPCSNELYHVEGYSSGEYVTWNLSGTGYSVITDVIPTNTEGNNYLGVHRTSAQTYADGTITATISSGGNTLGTVTKNINSAAGFNGTWYQSSNLLPPYTPDATPEDLKCSVYNITAGKQVVLQSDDFIGATITGNYTIFHNNNTVSFFAFSGNNYTIEGYRPGSCMAYKFRFLTGFDPTPLLLNISSTGRDYVFSLQNEQDGDRNAGSEAVKHPIEQWQLTIVKYETGQTMYNGIVKGSSITVNTTGWKPGIYIVMAKANENSTIQKLAITE